MEPFLKRLQTSIGNFFSPERGQNAPPEVQSFVPSAPKTPTIGRTIKGILSSSQGQPKIAQQTTVKNFMPQPTAVPQRPPQPTLTEEQFYNTVKRISPDMDARKIIEAYRAQYGNSPTPTASPMGTDSGQIPLRTDQGTIRPPRNIEQIIMDVFGPTNRATEAASVLNHPLSMGGAGKMTRGENQGFKTGREVDIGNRDGSIDRGLYRINSNTFADFQRRMPEVLEANGISSWDDMLDPLLNTKMAKIIQEQQGWGAWYAAPEELQPH